MTAAYAGTALPWNPPAGTVASSLSGITPTTVVTDPTLIAMAQQALWYIGTQASTYNLSLTPYPLAGPGGITGNINPAFTSALASFQSSSASSTFNQGTTPLNTTGTLDYKTLAAVIMGSMVYFTKQTGSSSGTSTSGVDAPLVDMATSGLVKIVSITNPSISTYTIEHQLKTIETNIDASVGANGALFAQQGVFNWQAWAMCVGMGA